MRLLKSLIYLYLIVGLGFGVARFGWGAMVAAMAEPDTAAFIEGLAAAAGDGGLRVVMWAPSLVTEVVQGDRGLIDWMLYS